MDLMDRRGFLRNVVGGAAIVTITANAGVTLLSNVAEAAPVPADKNLQKAMEDFAETVPLDLIPISLYSYPQSHPFEGVLARRRLNGEGGGACGRDS